MIALASSYSAKSTLVLAFDMSWTSSQSYFGGMVEITAIVVICCERDFAAESYIVNFHHLGTYLELVGVLHELKHGCLLVEEAVEAEGARSQQHEDPLFVQAENNLGNRSCSGRRIDGRDDLPIVFGVENDARIVIECCEDSMSVLAVSIIKPREAVAQVPLKSIQFRRMLTLCSTSMCRRKLLIDESVQGTLCCS